MSNKDNLNPINLFLNETECALNLLNEKAKKSSDSVVAHSVVVFNPLNKYLIRVYDKFYYNNKLTDIPSSSDVLKWYQLRYWNDKRSRGVLEYNNCKIRHEISMERLYIISPFIEIILDCTNVENSIVRIYPFIYSLEEEIEIVKNIKVLLKQPNLYFLLEYISRKESSCVYNI